MTTSSTRSASSWSRNLTIWGEVAFHVDTRVDVFLDPLP